MRRVDVDPRPRVVQTGVFTALIVDDSNEFRFSLRRLLAARFPFMQIVEAGDARNALQLAKGLQPDVAFVDVHLPDANGLDLLPALTQACSVMELCVVTGHDLPEYRAVARTRGADHFLAKGVAGRRELIEIVEAVLARRVKAVAMHRDGEMRRRLGALLTADWHAVIYVQCLDAREGFEQALALKPDIVLLEAEILREAQFALCRALKAAISGVTVVVIGNAGVPEDRESALGAGADSFLSASSAMDEQIGTLLSAIGGRGVGPAAPRVDSFR